MKRKICVVTSSRADYGLLYWLLKYMQVDADIDLQIVSCGMHLAPEFGLTGRIIEKDGFEIADRVEMLVSGDTPTAIAKSMGLGTIGFSQTFARLNPHIIVLLGDRFEILSAAQAALVGCFPVAHIHGGELTEGAFDDATRHAITKMSHLHFVSAEEYRRRVIQLGEQPERVHNCGAPGLDQIAKVVYLSRTQLERELEHTFKAFNFLVTIHPSTLEPGNAAQLITAVTEALEEFPEAGVVFTKPNADNENNIISRTIDEFVRVHQNRARAFTSLGTERYLSIMKLADAVIGNSSSALYETPLFGKPSVNIGIRQQGRLRATSVIDCADNKAAITAAIRQALSPEFIALAKATRSPYGVGDASARILEVLKGVDLTGLTRKKFYDLDVHHD